MAQLSSDDIGHVEELANSNRELSKNDFIFHIKVLPYPFLFRHILNLDGLTSKCFNKFFFRIPTCLSSLIVLIQSVTTIGMRRFFLHISFIVIKTQIATFHLLFFNLELVDINIKFHPSSRSGRLGRFLTRMGMEK